MSMLRLATILLAFALALPATAQDNEERLGIPGPVTFEDKQFELAWTSHPAPAYYKQEYVPAGQVVEAYVDMVMIDVLTEGQTPESATQTMIAGLEERKASGDPVVNYDMIANEATGELILDFLISDTSTGEIIVEWNAYRYTPLEDGGLTLFAISRRGYGEDGATEFLEGLTSWRETSIHRLAVMDLPPIAITVDR